MQKPPEEYVRDALQSLGGDRRLVRGAELAAHAFDLARNDDFDLQATLKSKGITFGTFLESIVEPLDLKIVRTHGTDLLVGFSAAAVEPIIENPIQFRRDVFIAFSRYEGGFAYNPISDEFGKNLGLAAVPVSSLSLEEAKEVRRRFAQKVGGGDEEALTNALNDHERPLQAYAKVVRERHLLGQWQLYFSVTLKQRVLDWAAQQGIAIRPSWFEPSPPSIKSTFVRHELREIIDGLSDEELGQMFVPLALVSKLWKQRKR